ncbi:MAG: GAF domain-containing protein [Deltaproteobacteria bacterium]|nr:GAF domain-containing protein [Deltaproteobacteria bacterium]
MGYDIFCKLIELTDSPEELDKRLDGVVNLLVKSFSFDQCSIYLWDGDAGVFNLVAAAGIDNSLVRAYREGDGLPGMAVKKGGSLVAYISPRGGGCSWRGVQDDGVKGFSTVVVSPLKDDTTLYGLLCLKSKGKKTIPARRRRLLEVVMLQIATAIKTSQCIMNLKDINTQLWETQARLVQVEKLLALGEMAATFVHEIKNPLVSIGGFAKRLCQQFAPDAPQRAYGDRIVKEVERLEEILAGMVHFSMDRGLELTIGDMNILAEDVLRLFQEDFEKRGIKVETEFSPSLPPVEVDTQQLKLAFNNLITNAIQVMGEGGVLTVKTHQDKEWVVAEVSDTGGGINPEVLGNIFNPFFTTKEGGTGLGLAITHTIITNHKGIIDVINNMGVGVTFVVRIPAVAGKELVRSLDCWRRYEEKGSCGGR